MKSKYTTPIIEMLNDVMEDSIMLPASPGGHTDEVLSREYCNDDYTGEDPSLTRSQGFDLWDE